MAACPHGMEIICAAHAPAEVDAGAQGEAHALAQLLRFCKTVLTRRGAREAVSINGMTYATSAVGMCLITALSSDDLALYPHCATVCHACIGGSLAAPAIPHLNRLPSWCHRRWRGWYG